VGDQPAKAQDEAILEIVAEGRDLIPIVTLSRGTTFQVDGWTKELVELAKAIQAAESKWMPEELLRFARDVLASRSTRVLPLETDPSFLGDEGEITSEEDFRQAAHARDALKQFGTIVRGILYEVSKRLEKEALEWSGSSRPTTIQ
jgi:hypothetical protein